MSTNNECSLCGKNKNLVRIHLCKGNISRGETHYDGDIDICEECLSYLGKCDKCGKHKMTSKLKQMLEFWDYWGFCTCDCDEILKEREVEREKFYQEKIEKEKRLIEQKKEQDYKIAKNLEKHISEINIEDIENFILWINGSYFVLDNCLASIFTIPTNEIRMIIEQNIKIFEEKDLYRLNDDEIQDFQSEYKDYVTTVRPYALSIYGIIKLSNFIDNNIAKDFTKIISESYIQHKSFSIEDCKLKILYKFLSDSYSIKEALKKYDKPKYEQVLHFYSKFKLPNPFEFVEAFLNMLLKYDLLNSLYISIDSFIDYHQLSCDITDEDIKKFINEYSGYTNNVIYPKNSMYIFNNFENYLINGIKNNWDNIKNNKSELRRFLFELGINLEIEDDDTPYQIKALIKELEKQDKINKIFDNFSWVICMLVYFISYYIAKLAFKTDVVSIYFASILNTCFVYFCLQNYLKLSKP